MNQRKVIQALRDAIKVPEAVGTVMDLPLANIEVTAAGVYRVIQIGNTRPYAAISASRLANTHEENKMRNKALLAEIKSAGFYAYDLIGMYQECPDGKPDCEEHEKEQTVEDSFFVPYREDVASLEDFADFFLKLTIKYEQDSYLLGLPNGYAYDSDLVKVAGNDITVGEHYYVSQTGEASSVGTRLEADTLKDYGSIAFDAKDRMIEFVIKGVLQPATVNGCRKFNEHGLTWFRPQQEQSDNAKRMLAKRSK